MTTPSAPLTRACVLHSLEGEGSADPVPVQPLPFFIGRNEECHMVLPGEGIMRKHAKIRCQDGQFFITDLATYQGTFVNGQSVVESQIRDGDIIRISEHKLRVAIREVVPVQAAGDGAEDREPRPSLAESLREIGPGTWAAAVLAVFALGFGMLTWSRWQERERIRTQDIALAEVELEEGRTELVEIPKAATATVDQPAVVVAQILPEGVLVEAVNEGTAQVVCTIPEQGTRRFQVKVTRARDPLARYPELKGVLALGPAERSRQAEEHVRTGDHAWSLRDDRLGNRAAALHRWILAVTILETLPQQTTLLDEARTKRTQAERELDDIWELRFSQLRQAYNVGDLIRARNEAYYLAQVFPDGSGKRNDIARVYLDQIKPK